MIAEAGTSVHCFSLFIKDVRLCKGSSARRASLKDGGPIRLSVLH